MFDITPDDINQLNDIDLRKLADMLLSCLRGYGRPHEGGRHED